MRLRIKHISVQRNQRRRVVGEQEVEIFQRFAEPETLHLVPVLRTSRRFDVSDRREANRQLCIPAANVTHETQWGRGGGGKKYCNEHIYLYISISQKPGAGTEASSNFPHMLLSPPLAALHYVSYL